MDTSQTSSSGKVAVTYWDPAALFQLIAPDLRARLPLRNLHWKSPTRPLRSINSLHVDLIPYSPPPTNLATPSTPSSAGELTRVRSSDSTRSIESTINRSNSRSRGHGRRERRHQIPGLRNTPYLKIYVLRCDDNDSYKNTQRKLLREWISTHATAASGDNHDAFEWLIIHVVLPGTPAAQQPRSSSSSSNPSGGSRWMKSGSTTLLDKIRSDFNGSSSKVDRIIQVRISPSEPALATLSPPVAITAAATPESPTETEIAWIDLITKFKAQILSSFDARVGQYEEDVREKDSQRRLPGWNFCTFFVLKEGLARAFESVGLVEDALVLYDELGFGLEGIVREQEKGEVIGGRFIAWTKEGLYWIEEARRCLTVRKKGEGEGMDEIDEVIPIDAEKKPYRELILSNEISVFDFRCYLFARQTTLLTRLGRRNGDIRPPSGGHSLQEAAAAVHNGEISEDDLHRLAEVCKRGVEFITTVSRVLRSDLTSGYQGSSEHPEDKDQDPIVSQGEIQAVIDNLISSWTYAVCTQLLDQTASSALPGGLEENSDRGLLPKRMSSLPAETTSFPHAINGAVSGLEELAAGRAELIILARTVLEAFGKKKRWIGSEGWFAVDLGEAEMEDVKLDIVDDVKNKQAKKVEWVPEGIRHKRVKNVMIGDEPQAFYKLFVQLSEKAMNYYGLAKRYKSAERVESDLAALKFHLKDYEQAAAHLKRMTNFYAEQGWGLIETTLLSMYATCLKEMQQPEEYINVVLKLLYKSATSEISRIQRICGNDEVVSLLPLESSHPFQPTNFNVKGYVAEALALSNSLSEEIVTPMQNLWSDITVDQFPRHCQDRDGFDVHLKMRYLLAEPLAIDKIAIKVISTGTPSREIWLESLSVPNMQKGLVKCVVTTNNTIPGSYVAEELVIYAGKLKFVHEFMAKAGLSPSLVTSSRAPNNSGIKKTKLNFFPSPRSVTARLAMPKMIHLEQTRTVDIFWSSGENTITKGEIRIRSATAGLRLITRSLEVLSETDLIGLHKDTPGTLDVKYCPPHTEIHFTLPYTSETDLIELMIRLEVDYTTSAGDFTYIDTLGVPVALPLAVNVQDVFKAECLYSKFQVCTAVGEVPLRILTANLHESRTFSTEAGKGTTGNLTVYAKQPANFIYKIRRKTATEGHEAMSLVIEYTNIDEERRILTLANLLEIGHSVASLFKTGLKQAGLENYMHWLLPSLFARLRNRSPVELETAALLEEIDIGNYSEYNWEEVLEAIPPRSGDRKRVSEWLKSFFATHRTVPLNDASVLAAIVRAILIPVSVPHLQVIHTISLKLNPPSLTRSVSGPEPLYIPPMVTIGQPIPCTLTISHSRSWDPSPSTVPLEFYYEIQNNPESWLVSGRKRAHFTGLAEGNTQTWPLVLVPTKSGNLVVPNVEIRTVNGGVNGGDDDGELAMETEYKANAQSVLVLPDVRSTTGMGNGKQHNRTAVSASLVGLECKLEYLHFSYSIPRYVAQQGCIRLSSSDPSAPPRLRSDWNREIGRLSEEMFAFR
ncbi:hypothetical protein EDC01DRAFT_636092 [Geopyxis carbonaria]|nr:hypothetical protein EDC01DRAFT_636092 [Geopyxis carbonaria]